MAKKEKVEVEAAPSKGRKIMLTDAKGNEVARVDVIKGLWKDGEGMSRADIVKALKEDYNHEVAYQIVFAATKKPKAVDTEEAAA